eukprot:TRINITY_DN6419_c0_g1_i1.p1 TRINITY_DN6419_c0_g1~~TRINITY_DN6419_c0_g1_i1.p1  ORF type:complete len:546 (+),score=124.01 TRINITY_DN6419_c0_g1_i1:105-1742(+)
MGHENLEEWWASVGQDEEQQRFLQAAQLQRTKLAQVVKKQQHASYLDAAVSMCNMNVLSSRTFQVTNTTYPYSSKSSYRDMTPAQLQQMQEQADAELREDAALCRAQASPVPDEGNCMPYPNVFECTSMYSHAMKVYGRELSTEHTGLTSADSDSDADADNSDHDRATVADVPLPMPERQDLIIDKKVLRILRAELTQWLSRRIYDAAVLANARARCNNHDGGCYLTDQDVRLAVKMASPRTDPCQLADSDVTRTRRGETPQTLVRPRRVRPAIPHEDADKYDKYDSDAFVYSSFEDDASDDERALDDAAVQLVNPAQDVFNNWGAEARKELLAAGMRPEVKDVSQSTKAIFAEEAEYEHVDSDSSVEAKPSKRRTATAKHKRGRPRKRVYKKKKTVAGANASGKGKAAGGESEGKRAHADNSSQQPQTKRRKAAAATSEDATVTDYADNDADDPGDQSDTELPWITFEESDDGSEANDEAETMSGLTSGGTSPSRRSKRQRKGVNYSEYVNNDEVLSTSGSSSEIELEDDDDAWQPIKEGEDDV